VIFVSFFNIGEAVHKLLCHSGFYAVMRDMLQNKATNFLLVV